MGIAAAGTILLPTPSFASPCALDFAPPPGPVWYGEFLTLRNSSHSFASVLRGGFDTASASSSCYRYRTLPSSEASISFPPVDVPSLPLEGQFCQCLQFDSGRCWSPGVATACPTTSFLRVTRFGEARHPGPHGDHMNFRVAITNPTSIISKLDVYKEIASACQVDLFACAETSATCVAQQTFTRGIRKMFPYQCWSPPVQDHVLRSDGAPSQRGKAGGTCVFASFPLRPAL